MQCTSGDLELVGMTRRRNHDAQRLNSAERRGFIAARPLERRVIRRNHTEGT